MLHEVGTHCVEYEQVTKKIHVGDSWEEGDDDSKENNKKDKEYTKQKRA